MSTDDRSDAHPERPRTIPVTGPYPPVPDPDTVPGAPAADRRRDEATARRAANRRIAEATSRLEPQD